MLRPFYDWLLRQAASRHATLVLALLAFVEPIFLPVPPDVMLAPMVVMKPERVWRYAAITAVASVAGGCASYFIGYLFVDWAQFWMKRGHFSLAEYKHFFAQWGILLILAKGFLPVPYMIITYAAGAAQFSFLQFLLAAALTRGGRFCLTAFLSKKFGPQVQARIEKNLMLWASIFVAAAVLLVVLIHYIS